MQALSRYVKIGEEHTRTLEMKPGYLYVKDTVRPTYALKNEMEAVDNGGKAVITAPMPLMPIYKGMPGASMLAEVLLQKYEYHVPFYRQVKQLEHLGVKLSRNTLDGWFRPVCELLRPLYLKLRKKVLAADYLQVDETTLPVINHERHKAAKEYIWIVRAAVPRLLFFHYDNGSRSQKVAVRLLKNFKGYLQSDGHPIYDAFEDREDVCLCGCLAHIRRHIELCKEENPEYAMQGLKFIQDMYNVEYMADKQELPYEGRAELRQRLSEPILDSFELWLKNTYPKVLKRSLMGKAIAYAYSLLPRMKPYLHDGRIFIDNNRCENALRPLVISRKNMLFCGNHEAAENTAIICSLLGSCKERGVNPREWLNDVISKLPYYLARKLRCTYNGVHPTEKSNAQDVVEQSLTIYLSVGERRGKDSPFPLRRLCKKLLTEFTSYLNIIQERHHVRRGSTGAPWPRHACRSLLSRYPDFQDLSVQ